MQRVLKATLPDVKLQIRQRWLISVHPANMGIDMATRVSRHMLRQSLAQSTHTGNIQFVPIFVMARALASQLQKPCKRPCGRGCICGSRNMCLVKDVVYEIVCKHCQAKYIGETHRTLRQRLSEHVSAYSRSHVYAHISRMHKNQPSLADLQFNIRQGGFQNALHRKAFEADLITLEKPSINVQLAS